jgi:phosphatidylserine/phosphatidylglycerophosphate/cardiolipin synthase-like enzyme
MTNIKNKKDILYVSAIIFLTGVAAQSYYTYHYQPEHQIAVYYNQDHPLNTEVINQIRNADKFVYFAVYTFTRQDIAQALLAAKYRGLDVRGLTDTEQYSTASGQKEIINQLRKAGIPVYLQQNQGIMHMKALVTDKSYLSGSYNWTSSATNLNDEILEVGTDEAVREQYQSNLLEVIDKYQNNPENNS